MSAGVVIVCVCVCVCVCVGTCVGGGGGGLPPMVVKLCRESGPVSPQGQLKKNTCRLVMVADMAIQRFLKGVHTAYCGNNVVCRNGNPAGKAPRYKICLAPEGS